ncbi:MAG: hypothetical protein V4438_02635 [Patescibacteria group bacterium]
MKNSQRGFVGIAIAVLIALGLLSFGGYKIFHKNAPVEEESNAPIGNFPSDYKPADHTASAVASDGKIYSNKRYGYELSFSDSWRDHQILENSDGSVDFKVKTLSGTGEYWPLWHIVPEDVKTWDRDAAECASTSKDAQSSHDLLTEWETKCMFLHSKIARNDKYVFMAISAQDYDNKDTSLHDDFWSKIVPTFKFTK